MKRAKQSKNNINVTDRFQNGIALESQTWNCKWNLFDKNNVKSYIRNIFTNLLKKEIISKKRKKKKTLL